MATHMGNGGLVKVSTATVLNIISWSLTESANIADDTTLGDAYATHITGGVKNWSGSVSGYFNEADTTGQELLVSGASIDLHLLVDGATTGDIDFNGTVTIVGVERAVANDTTTTANFTFTGNGPLTKSVLA